MGGRVDESCVLTEGPWSHRFVGANGSRFHVAEVGTGPLVLFLHGFPEFWWAWHDIMTQVADAGFRAAAIDLRGYGASDKPPRGYDGYTMAADVTGLIRALGERSATVVGAGAGGMIGWAAASFHPKLVNRLVVLGAAHPLRLRAALFADPRGQFSASSPVVRFQVPRYEHVLTRDDAAMVGELMSRWSSPRFAAGPEFADYSARCREAMQIPQASFCALEAYRWVARSALRLQGYRFVKLMQRPSTVPTLQLHGGLDTAVLPRTAQGSGRYVTAAYEWRLLPEAGHFLHREAPELVTGEILRWLKTPS